MIQHSFKKINIFIMPKTFYISNAQHIVVTSKYIKKVFFIADIPRNLMEGFNRELIQSKLKEMGMDNIAEKLNNISDKEIEKMIRSNPGILKKASQMMKGGIPKNE